MAFGFNTSLGALRIHQSGSKSLWRSLSHVQTVGRSRARIVVSATVNSERDRGKGKPEESTGPNWTGEGDFALKAAISQVVLGFAVPVLAAAYQSNGNFERFQSLLGSRYLGHFEMMALLLAFGVAHSGLASLRPKVVPAIGERAYRLGFALMSIPFAVFNIAYFIAHRYDGMQLWTIQGVPGVSEAVWIATAISFYLLYPATFNLLEIVAVQKPTFRIYETGVMRITRHPQLWGQLLWCAAHGAWMGTTMPVVASAGLLAHHFFGAWNGDRRLRNKYGEEWEKFAERTSLVPFQAVLDGRQKLSLQEFLKPAYLGVSAFIVGLSAAHPLMLRAAGYFPF
mmetsp:Transcript_7716/g.23371  ORF Transcript_7716/g.23371 Transcript_7716/m.23371 type:complete len:340 (-) Transcript_7716:52-1071(-)